MTRFRRLIRYDDVRRNAERLGATAERYASSRSWCMVLGRPPAASAYVIEDPVLDEVDSEWLFAFAERHGAPLALVACLFEALCPHGTTPEFCAICAVPEPAPTPFTCATCSRPWTPGRAHLCEFDATIDVPYATAAMAPDANELLVQTTRLNCGPLLCACGVVTAPPPGETWTCECGRVWKRQPLGPDREMWSHQVVPPPNVAIQLSSDFAGPTLAEQKEQLARAVREGLDRRARAAFEVEADERLAQLRRDKERELVATMRKASADLVMMPAPAIAAEPPPMLGAGDVVRFRDRARGDARMLVDAVCDDGLVSCRGVLGLHRQGELELVDRAPMPVVVHLGETLPGRSGETRAVCGAVRIYLAGGEEFESSELACGACCRVKQARHNEQRQAEGDSRLLPHLRGSAVASAPAARPRLTVCAQSQYDPDE